VPEEQAGPTRVRVGIIGAGAWAVASHIPVLAARGDEVELVGVCRKGAAELAMIAERFGFAMASEDYRDVLAAGIDLCIVSSPAALHHEHALAALRAGVHVLVEKPMTIVSAQATELTKAAAEARLQLLVAFGFNYLPAYRKAYALMADGALGDIEHVLLHMGSGTRELLLGQALSSTGNPDDHADTATWTDPRLSGGGYGQAQLSHAFAFMLGLTGLSPATVYAVGSPPQAAGRVGQAGPVELHAAMTIRFGNGATGSVSGLSYHAGAQHNRHQFELRVCGSEGQLHVDLERDRLWMWRRDAADPTADPAAGLAVELPTDAGVYNCAGPVDTAVDLVLGRPAVNYSPGELGAQTVALLEAAYASMRSGKPEPVR
jgi:predicted dehydrogenase